MTLFQTSLDLEDKTDSNDKVDVDIKVSLKLSDFTLIKICWKAFMRNVGIFLKVMTKLLKTGIS